MSAASISRLSRPKHPEITEDDLTSKAFNMKELLKGTRNQICEYVRDALASDQKNQMINKLKPDYDKNILNNKSNNEKKSQIYQKQIELKRLKNYSNNLEKLIQERFASNKTSVETLKDQNAEMERKVLIEEMTTATLSHMFSRDKQDMLAIFKPIAKIK